jgi:DNA invertase Pin-like site-specific DNA recombinase
MKLDFCAVCGVKTDLHQHHIEPVVFSKIDRKKVKGYDAKKQLKDCTSMEIFKWLFDQGIISDDGEITVCSYHHHLIHGIVKFQKAEHINLVKEGQRKARERGIHIGRPTIVNDDMRNEVSVLRDNKVGIRTIAKRLNIGIGTVYSIIQQSKEVQ